MADYSSLGVYGGYYGLQQAQSETAMLKSQAQLEAFKVQEAPVEIAIKNLELKNAESLYARQQRMLAQMDSVQNSGAPGSVAGQVNSEAERAADVMFKQSEIQRNNGFYQDANESASKAASILDSNSKVQTRNANLDIKMAKDVRNMLAVVHDKNSWDDLRATFPQLHPDEAKLPAVQQILQMEYDSFGGQAGIKRMADSMTSREESARTTASLAAAQAHSAEARRADAYTKDYLPKLENLADKRAQAIERAGGKAAKVTPSDITAMQKIIEAKLPNADPNQAYVLGRHLAQDVAALTARGVSKADAQDQVMSDALKSQYFAGIRRTRDTPGATPATALAVSKDTTEADLKDGMYYMLPSEGLRVYDAKAKGFVKPNPAAITAQEEEVSDELPVDLDESQE